MQMTNHTSTAIAALDLEPIKIKLRHHSGEGWSEARANAIEKEYRRFLILQHIYQGEASSPTADVDTFWHYHILDTVKYAADCKQAFGYFMHHYPYVGLLEGDEEGVVDATGNRTRELYEATFGEAYIRAESYGKDGNGIDVHQSTFDGQHSDEQAQAAEAARCTTWCAAGKPKGAAAEGARCTTWCAAGKPKAVAAEGARCTTWCAAGKPKTAAAKAARCMWCITAEPKAEAAKVPSIANPHALLNATRQRQAAAQFS